MLNIKVAAWQVTVLSLDPTTRLAAFKDLNYEFITNYQVSLLLDNLFLNFLSQKSTVYKIIFKKPFKATLSKYNNATIYIIILTLLN